MSRNVLIEEFHLSFRAPARKPDREISAAKKELNRAIFRAAIRESVEGLLAQQSATHEITVQVTR